VIAGRNVRDIHFVGFVGFLGVRPRVVLTDDRWQAITLVV
jgi:hypothetical protein